MQINICKYIKESITFAKIIIARFHNVFIKVKLEITNILSLLSNNDILNWFIKAKNKRELLICRS